MEAVAGTGVGGSAGLLGGVVPAKDWRPQNATKRQACTPTNALHHACMPQNAFHTHACAATFAPTPLHGFYLCCDGPYCWAKP
eukprot:1136955-Pelagomonas_calceolata.AAC.1